MVGMLIGAIVGSSSGVLLLLIPVAIILVLCRLKKGKTKNNYNKTRLKEQCAYVCDRALMMTCSLFPAKTLKRECVTDHYYQEQPIAQSESFIRSHPPSEPIYEHIRDCQGQSKECILEADDRKNFRSSSTQFVQVAVIDVPPLPLFAERARHTPDGDYVEMKVTAMTEAPGESNCGGFSLPCGHLRETL